MEICCNPQRLLHVDEYRRHYSSHTPDMELLDALAGVSELITVLLVFGYWCHDSARIVPELLKALEVADNPNLQLLAVHVAYQETDPSPFMAGPLPVTQYPTIFLIPGHYQALAEIPRDIVPRLELVEVAPTAAAVHQAFPV